MGTMYTALNACKTVEMSSLGWTQAVTPYMTKVLSQTVATTLYFTALLNSFVYFSVIHN